MGKTSKRALRFAFGNVYSELLWWIQGFDRNFMGHIHIFLGYFFSRNFLQGWVLQCGVRMGPLSYFLFFALESIVWVEEFSEKFPTQNSWPFVESSQVIHERERLKKIENKSNYTNKQPTNLSDLYAFPRTLTMYFFLFYFCIVLYCFRPTPGSTQGRFVALCSGISSLEAWGIIWGVRKWIWFGHL